MLKLFWGSHDSTTCHSRQYMSAIFYHGDEQKELAEISKTAFQKQKMKKIVTKILPAQTFYNAENYHQKYLLRNQSGLLASFGLGDKQIISSYVACKVNGYVGGYGSEDQFDKDLPSLGLSSEQEEYIRHVIDRKYPAK
ncbi:peptide methionine sulfoxide reductase-like [Watersipora subatra]|uniref:peptide methionine sulfoxide reductase-like n=1 Tax=Watersipora subatra TaxID=2589382 RepID=UPI00355B76D4